MQKLFSLKPVNGQIMDVFAFQTNGTLVSVLCSIEGQNQNPMWQVLSPSVSQGLIDGMQGLMQEAKDVMS